MTTTSQSVQKPIINQLNENADAGFTKSVDALYNDIITFLNHRTEAGFRVCQYNKRWSEFGTMMSPVHIGYEGVAQNNVLLPDADRDKLLDAVRQKLVSAQINVNRCSAKYFTTNNVNYTMQFQIDLEVPHVLGDTIDLEVPHVLGDTIDLEVLPTEKAPSVTITSPSHSLERHNYDFNCASC